MMKLIFLTVFVAAGAHAETFTLNVACSLVPGQICAYDAPPGQPVECMPSGELVCSCDEAVAAFRSELQRQFPSAYGVQFVQRDGSRENGFYRFDRDKCVASSRETAVFSR